MLIHAVFAHPPEMHRLFSRLQRESLQRSLVMHPATPPVIGALMSPPFSRGSLVVHHAFQFQGDHLQSTFVAVTPPKTKCHKCSFKCHELSSSNCSGLERPAAGFLEGNGRGRTECKILGYFHAGKSNISETFVPRDALQMH